MYIECSSGAVLWNIDPNVVHPTWNFYNSLVMPDLTQDGVPEVLFSHGGDPRFEASVRHSFTFWSHYDRKMYLSVIINAWPTWFFRLLSSRSYLFLLKMGYTPSYFLAYTVA